MPHWLLQAALPLTTQNANLGWGVGRGETEHLHFSLKNKTQKTSSLNYSFLKIFKNFINDIKLAGNKPLLVWQFWKQRAASSFHISPCVRGEANVIIPRSKHRQPSPIRSVLPHLWSRPEKYSEDRGSLSGSVSVESL